MSRRERRARLLWKSAFNLPNQLTFLRLFLAIILFGFIADGQYMVSLILFVIAAGTDWLDGYFARKYGQVTTLGRILDPFADKVIICGTFVFLAVIPEMARTAWGLRAWMVVVIVARELLITALRSFVEDRGSNFSANMAGKLKMVLQCIAAGTCLLYLHYTPGLTDMTSLAAGAPDGLRWAMIGSVWTAVLLTVYSGVGYVGAAARLIREAR